jgi:hypothetical protein
VPRPLPPIPRLARRKITANRAVLLGCPRISPEWELGALRALIKPQTGAAIRHLPAAQSLPKDRQNRVANCLNVIADRLGYRPTLHWPEAGDYLFIAEVPAGQAPEARALAIILSNELPGIWILLGRLFIRDGAFFRRERGFKLTLVPATNIHLTRPIRSALNGVL